MAELHWFPVDRDEWFANPAIAAMLPEQEGAYWRLLLTSWGDGSVEPSLPAEAQQLATLSKLGPRWKKLGALVRAQFEERDGRLYSAWFSALWAEQTAKHTKASDKARVAANARAEKRRVEDAARTAASTPPGTPPRSAPSAAPSRTPSTAPGHASGIQNLEGTAPDSTPDGVESQEHVPAPGDALAPAGAAPRVAGATANGNGLGTLPRADVIARLEEMGLPGSTWVEAEQAQLALSRAELEERRKLLETAYHAQLHARADAWFARHPDEAGQMEMLERANLLLPAAGEGTLKSWQTRALRDAMVEAYRCLPRANPIPRCAEWVAAREAEGSMAGASTAEADDS
jgi:hypothetical protein